MTSYQHFNAPPHLGTLLVPGTSQSLLWCTDNPSTHPFPGPSSYYTDYSSPVASHTHTNVGSNVGSVVSRRREGFLVKDDQGES
jgi:hypothetical protein